MMWSSTSSKSKSKSIVTLQRSTSTSITLVLISLACCLSLTTGASASTAHHTLIDGRGRFPHNQRETADVVFGGGEGGGRGVVAVIDPSNSLFPQLVGDDESGDGEGGVEAHVVNDAVIVTSAGANAVAPSIATIKPPPDDDEEDDDEVGGQSLAASRLTTGYGCAAASAPAGVIVVNGFEPSDLGLPGGEGGGDDGEHEYDGSWVDTRLGRTIRCVFASKEALRMNGRVGGAEKPLIVLGVNGRVTSLKLQQEVIGTVGDLYREVREIAKMTSASAASSSTEEEEEGGDEGGDEVSLEDACDVILVQIQSQDDADGMMVKAIEEAKSRTPKVDNVATLVGESYSGAPSSPGTRLINTILTSPRPVVEAMLLCDDVYARDLRSVRARLSPWKQRVARKLVVDRFGMQATALYGNVLKNYDLETLAVSGGPAAAYRLRQRAKLQNLLRREIRVLFEAQIAVCEGRAVQRLQRTLLRMRKRDAQKTVDGEDAAAAVAQGYDNNAAAVRDATFAFDTRAGELEVPPLSLYKTRYSEDVSARLHEALAGFPDSSAAQLQDMKTITKAANRKATIKKSQQGNERSIDLGVSLVAMFRPDGYGNLQGFTGYNLGPHSVTVGVQNDADSPETISQFGGVRPPFLRVQPKLNVDIEL